MRKHKQIYQDCCWRKRNPNSKKRIVFDPLWKDRKTMLGISQSDNNFKYFSPKDSCVVILPFSFDYTSKSLFGYAPASHSSLAILFLLLPPIDSTLPLGVLGASLCILQVLSLEPMPACISCSDSYIHESLVILRNGVLLVSLKKASEIILFKSFSNQISYWVSSLK